MKKEPPKEPKFKFSFFFSLEHIINSTSYFYLQIEAVKLEPLYLILECEFTNLHSFFSNYFEKIELHLFHVSLKNVQLILKYVQVNLK